MLKRIDGRSFDELRPLKITLDPFGYADSTVLFEIGGTKVLVAVSMQQGVPPFLKGTKTGWLTAEYAMLPTATQQRTQRESNMSQRNGRSVEISRLIGRCLRPLVDLQSIGERTIYIDCDVLQADGGTRVAAITAASIALDYASKKWIQKKLVTHNVIKEFAVGVSIGILGDTFFLDPSQVEDNKVDADFNFVLSSSGNILEIQGTAEKEPISWKKFDDLKLLSIRGVNKIFAFVEASKNAKMPISSVQTTTENKSDKVPLFSLGNRKV